MTTPEQLAARVSPVTFEALPPKAFRARRTIRFGHCDPAGIVFTPRFVDLLQAVIERFFGEAMGLDYYGFIRERGVGLGYAALACTFFSPAMLGERLEFVVSVTRVGRSSASFTLHAFREGEPVMQGDLVMATTALSTHKSILLPKDLRDGLLHYRNQCS